MCVLKKPYHGVTSIYRLPYSKSFKGWPRSLDKMSALMRYFDDNTRSLNILGFDKEVNDQNNNFLTIAGATLCKSSRFNVNFYRPLSWFYHGSESDY